MKWLMAVIVMCLAASAIAHEVRPAYLELREARPGEFEVLWKTPMRGEFRLSLTPEFAAQTARITPIATRHSGGASIQTWRIRAIEPLRGRSLRIAGLEGTMTDVLVRAAFADGDTWTHRLTPVQASARIPERETGLGLAIVYIELGVEHILLGVDHLLFVFALLLITRGVSTLVKTITAFTLAHSITLGLATLGLVHVPAPPVEAAIALSIVFVAAEIVRATRGRNSVAVRAPWVVAFVFGLVHGLGFAGALSEVGLPQGQIPLALLFFNLGVEFGQLLFIAFVLSTLAASRRIGIPRPRGSDLVPPYAIGSVAMFWVIQRIATF